MCLLKWWFMFCLSILAFVGAFFPGWAQAVWNTDETKISILIITLYFSFSVFIGWLTYQAEKLRNFQVEKHLKSCHMAVKSMIVLGIIGTTAGLLIMLHLAFASPDLNPTAVLMGLKTGLSTLGITTIVGLICYLALELQVVNLEYALE